MRAKLLVLSLAAMLLILCTACTGGNGDPSVSPEASSPPSSGAAAWSASMTYWRSARMRPRMRSAALALARAVCADC
jgi:hypothetical protein